MTNDEHTLVLLMEECAEAAQRASKQLRFGRDEVQPGQDETNAQRLRFELNDVLYCIYMLEQSGQIPVATAADIVAHGERKQAKVERMMALSRSQGRLAPEARAAIETSKPHCEHCGALPGSHWPMCPTLNGGDSPR